MFVYEGRPVEVKVTVAQMVKNTYSYIVKLRSAIYYGSIKHGVMKFTCSTGFRIR